MKKKNYEFKIGIVTIIGLVLLIAGIILGQGFNFSSEVNVLKIRFNNSGGIKLSAPVVINGVKRGNVIGIESENGAVLIKALLDKTDDIKEDATAKITILEITGGKKIEINPGVSNNKFSINNIMLGKNTADIGDLVATLGDVSGDAINLIRRLDTITTSLNKIFSNDSLFKKLEKTVYNLSDLVADADRLLNNNFTALDESIKNIRSITGDLKDALKNNKGNVDTILVELKSTIKETRALLKSADGTVNSVNSLVTDVNSITKDIKTNGSTVNRLLYDKALALKLDTAFMKIAELADFINQHGVNVNVRLGTRP